MFCQHTHASLGRCHPSFPFPYSSPPSPHPLLLIECINRSQMLDPWRLLIGAQMSALGFPPIFMFCVTENDSSSLWYFYSKVLELQSKLPSFLGLLWNNVCIFMIQAVWQGKYCIFLYKPYEFADKWQSQVFRKEASTNIAPKIQV